MESVMAMRCREYSEEMIRIKLEAALEGLGGVDCWLRPGDHVLLKVNLLTAKKPEEAVTTHPLVVKALAEILMEAGAAVTIGDSPGGPFTAGRMKHIYRVTGMEQAAALTGAVLNQNMESGTVHYAEGYRLKDFSVMKVLEKVDHVISLSKMKTHSMTLMTGAVKNLFGIMPGLEKAELHFRFADQLEFSHALVDICEYVSPVLSVMDGIEAMEGAGPSAGSVRKSGLLLVSRNPHALDLAAAHFMGIAPEKVPTLKVAAERGLCNLSEDESFITGVYPKDLDGAFQLPEIKEPDFLKRFAGWPLIGPSLQRFSHEYLRPKPRVQQEKCVVCGECGVICRAEAITMTPEAPEFNYLICIRCFCCQEICPEKAIIIERSRLLKLFR